MPTSGVYYAFAAAALFGLSTPISKMLLGGIDPMLLAGLLYLGSGIGLAAMRGIRSRARTATEARLSRTDLPWLAGAVLSGGLIGPILLMIGLLMTPASVASLLLIVEGAATALIAWLVFRENVDRRIAVGMASILLGAAVLSFQGFDNVQHVFGPLAILGACIAWGIDNNLTRKVSLADPSEIAMYKGLTAGTANLAIALLMGAKLPALPFLSASLIVGFLGYGLSLVLFVLALRSLGTARTGAYFSTAPFIGTAVALALNGDPMTIQIAIATLLMASGVWLHLTERHEHEHEHDALEHEHRHRHDIHHMHAHTAADPAGEPHSHRHAHVKLRHAHAHTPDSHHQHAH